MNNRIDQLVEALRVDDVEVAKDIMTEDVPHHEGSFVYEFVEAIGFGKMTFHDYSQMVQDTIRQLKLEIRGFIRDSNDANLPSKIGSLIDVLSEVIKELSESNYDESIRTIPLAHPSIRFKWLRGKVENPYERDKYWYYSINSKWNADRIKQLIRPYLDYKTHSIQQLLEWLRDQSSKTNQQVSNTNLSAPKLTWNKKSNFFLLLFSILNNEKYISAIESGGLDTYAEQLNQFIQVQNRNGEAYKPSSLKKQLSKSYYFHDVNKSNYDSNKPLMAKGKPGDRYLELSKLLDEFYQKHYS